jgi:pimeloyl-ACP methyl ester carboxylesterase
MTAKSSLSSLKLLTYFLHLSHFYLDYPKQPHATQPKPSNSQTDAHSPTVNTAPIEPNRTDGIKKVIHNNGSGGSRLEWPGDQEMLQRLNISFVSVDRPGHGLSDPQPNRTLLGWADDIRQLADHLQIDQFYVEGWSAGGHTYDLWQLMELQISRVTSIAMGN